MYLLHEFDKVISPGFFSLSVALLSPFSSPFIFFLSSCSFVLRFLFLFSKTRLRTAEGNTVSHFLRSFLFGFTSRIRLFPVTPPWFLSRVFHGRTGEREMKRHTHTHHLPRPRRLIRLRICDVRRVALGRAALP